MSDSDTLTELIYRALVEHPEWGPAELSEQLLLTQDEVRAALDRLSDLALLHESYENGQPRALGIEAALCAALLRQQELAESQVRIARLLTARVREPQEQASDAGLERLHGIDAVQDRLAAFAAEAKDEIWTLMPGGAQSPAVIEAAKRHDAQVLARGARIRTVGLDSVRNDPATLDYARWLTASGGSFRTVPVLPTRLVIVDREAALVPLEAANTRVGALCVTEPGVISVLTALFERVWAEALPLHEDGEDIGEVSRLEKALLELLATGLTDESAAGRLGISQRTARRIMSDLMDRLGAHSRFEAGVKCALRGWL